MGLKDLAFSGFVFFGFRVFGFSVCGLCVCVCVSVSVCVCVRTVLMRRCDFSVGMGLQGLHPLIAHVWQHVIPRPAARVSALKYRTLP